MSKLIMMLAVFLIVFMNVESVSPNKTISVEKTIASASHGERLSKTLPIIRRNKQVAPSPDGAIHKHAYGAQTGANYFGTRAILSVWKPKVPPRQASLSQVWVTSTPGPKMNTIEAGWRVENDVLSFFTYWTVSNYQGKQCYNLECEGYTQVSKELKPGQLLFPSVYDGNKIFFEINIFMDRATNSWKLKVDGALIGYWKEDLFPELKNGASILLWGGEVIVPGDTLPGHFPPMGSGVRPVQPPIKNDKRVCFVDRIMVTDSRGNESPAKPKVGTNAPECFGTVEFDGGFFFGGTCPGS